MKLNLLSVFFLLSTSAWAGGTETAAKPFEKLNLFKTKSCPACGPYNDYAEKYGGGKHLSELEQGAIGTLIDNARGVTTEKQIKCDKSLIPYYSQIAPYCEASRMAEYAANLNGRVVTFYLTAVAVCGVACNGQMNRDAAIESLMSTESAASGASTKAISMASDCATSNSTTASIQGPLAEAKTHLSNVQALKLKDNNVSAETTMTTLETLQATMAQITSNWEAVQAQVAVGASDSSTTTSCTPAIEPVATAVSKYAAVSAAAGEALSAATLYNKERWACIGAVGTALTNDLLAYKQLKETGAKSANSMTQVYSAATLGVGAALAYNAYTAPVSDGGNTITSCVMTGILAAVTVMRYQNISTEKKAASSACKSATEQSATNFQQAGVDPICKPSETPSPPPEASLEGTASATRGANTGRQGVHGADSGVGADYGDFDNPELLHAATAGVGGDLVPHLDKDAIKNRADELGINTKQIGAAVASGASPASILGGLSTPKLGPLVGVVKGMEDLASKGQLFQEGVVAGTAYSGSRGKGSPATAGAKAPGGFTPSVKGGGKASEVAFGKAVEVKPTYDGSDIWHTGYKGTIFDLISRKLEIRRDRVTQLDYAIPFNNVMSTNKNTSGPPPTTSRPVRK